MVKKRADANAVASSGEHPALRTNTGGKNDDIGDARNTNARKMHVDTNFPVTASSDNSRMPLSPQGSLLRRLNNPSSSRGTTAAPRSLLAKPAMVNPRLFPAPAPVVKVALLSKNEQSKMEYVGSKGEVVNLGEIYLNDLSDIRVFEFTNLKPRRLRLQLKAELRKPFHTSDFGFQLENENVNLMDGQHADKQTADDFNHVPVSVVRPSSKASLCAENVYLREGYNELFNHIGRIDEVILEPNQTQHVIFSLCTKLSRQSSTNAGISSSYATNGDSSEEERLHLSETSCLVFTGRLLLKPLLIGGKSSEQTQAAPLPAPDISIPLHGQVCRSLLRLDVKELHFDDCVPGGSFVKDFTVWNRSEIPLLFKLVSSLSTFEDTREQITCTDYNSGYVIGDKTLQAAAYGHVRIRITYRPREIGERFFELHAQNLHDSRNVKILKIHAITNKEHHSFVMSRFIREGLSIKEPSGSYLMSGSKLDFGDCYTGIANSKVLHIRNTTEASLHVELTSDRPKEITFELKLQQNRARSSRAPRNDDVLSPTESNDGSSRKGSLSPDTRRSGFSFSNMDSYGLDSDEDGDENEMDIYDEEFQLNKRLSFEENGMVDMDDADDDFEFDRESRAITRSPQVSPKVQNTSQAESRKRPFRTKGKRSAKVLSRVRDLTYESGVDSGNSLCSSPERKSRTDIRKRQPASVEDNSGPNFLVETIDLPPGVERTILVWYTPLTSTSSELMFSESSDGIDLKGCRLTKQTFRVSFRCFQIQGSWQQAQSRVYDRTLGKSIHIRARTCTSIVTATPSILHLGDCNIGELKSSSCMLTNHSELPTIVKPLVTSKVISTVPNDELTLGPKQSTELKVEIIPRKTNPNYSRLISIMNFKNKSNIPQICVRSSNMDAHHVIYHSLFYKLLTPSKSAFLNFDNVAINSAGIQVFDLENITNAPLHLNVQSSDPSKVRLYCIKIPFGSVEKTAANREEERNDSSRKDKQFQTLRSTGNIQVGAATNTAQTQAIRHSGRAIRRRRSFGSISELGASTPTNKRGMPHALRGYLSNKSISATQSSSLRLASSGSSSGSLHIPTALQSEASKHRSEHGAHSGSTPGSQPSTSFNAQDSGNLRNTSTSSVSIPTTSPLEELAALLHLYEKSRSECDQYCHSMIPSHEKEQEIVGMTRERIRCLQSLIARKQLVLLNNNKERNLRIPPKSQQRIIAVISPTLLESTPSSDAQKIRIEKHKILITLPPGGNKKAITDSAKFDQNKATWAIAKHPFDSRSSVRELLLKSRVCRSVMNVNQKNINFGRIAASSKSTKKLVVQNMSAIPLVYSVEKTGSISSGFLEIKEGEVGVVKAFGTKEICFEFQPTLAGPFEEKLKIVNVQDMENSISVTIKAKVVKRETFKLLQSGQVLSLGKCLVGEKTDEIKIAVRNTSRKRREYVIQVDPAFSSSTLRPTFFFAMDETPSTSITQAQEKKLDEDLEKLEHKLRIAVTKKKADKILKLNSKISRVKALLNGEQVQDDIGTDTESLLDSGSTESTGIDVYDSCNSESEYSESEAIPRRRRRSNHGRKASTDTKNGAGNVLHFSLEAEATGRIVAYAIFQAVRSRSGSLRDGGMAPRSHKAKKRQLRRDATPMVGVGKFLLYEQQNKDVVKELQYSAEVFSRTAAGESAYSRAVGKSVLPLVPRSPHPIGDTAPADETVLQPINEDCFEVSGKGRESHKEESRLSSPPSQEKDSDRVLNLAIVPESSRLLDNGLVEVQVESHHTGISHSSCLVIPVQETPADTHGWEVKLSLQSPSQNGSAILEVQWSPFPEFQKLLGIECAVTPHDRLALPAQEQSRRIPDGEQYYPLPLNVEVVGDQNVRLHFKWCFIAGSGFAASSSLASCVSRSILENVSRTVEFVAGKIEFSLVKARSPTGVSNSPLTSPLTTFMNVALSKAVQQSLHFEEGKIDLGEQQLNSEVNGTIVVRNSSDLPAKFLLLANSVRDQGGVSTSNAVGLSSGGEITFDSATGHVKAGSHAIVHFTCKATIPGQHCEQILLRNLDDRSNTSVLTLTLRVVRPVYVRIPELDPHATGTLEVLNLGACYITPEMQDTAVDSPNVSLKFSKVHKLTLHSQVDETLVLCASSNLKTQCYVYEDSRLHREATHVILKGLKTVDLFIAVRPRLSGDAFKTGAARDLVGGIRFQLFSLPLEHSPSHVDEEKSDMVAEFTVKFIGVAGVSLARVTPAMIDFGVEYINDAQVQIPRSHQGRFELINVSKALPFHYRLFVTTDTEGYSDDDDSLHVSLKHEKGEIAPGETGAIEFQLMAYTNGLFRRRILVENIHYPGKINFVDVVLFVDNGALKCEILGSETSTSDDGMDFVQCDTVDFGVVNVIKLEEEFSDVSSISGGESDMICRKYRVFGGFSEGVYVPPSFESSTTLIPSALTGGKCMVLTNTTQTDLLLRPVSTLPLLFIWKPSELSSIVANGSHSLNRVIPQRFPVNAVRKLQLLEPKPAPLTENSGIFCGDTYHLAPQSSCELFFRFAPIAMTSPLLGDMIDNGKLYPFSGMVGIQGFGVGSNIEDDQVNSSKACTLKNVQLRGAYGESSFQIIEKHISLGKIGYGKTSNFEITVKNVSEVDVFLAIARMPACIVVRNVRDATAITLHEDGCWSKEIDPIPSLRHLALNADKIPSGYAYSRGSCAWKLQPMTTCVMEMEFVRSPEFFHAGVHEFPLRFLNLYNPHNTEDISVRAQLISTYAELVVDPESSIVGAIEQQDTSKHTACLPPVTIPPPQDASPHGSSFWFSIKNVYDEALRIKLSSKPSSMFERTFEFHLISRSANTPLSIIPLAPGDSVDVRVVCHVFPSARLSPDMWLSSADSETSELLNLGSVWLDISVDNVNDTAQSAEVDVKGKLLPGRTFMLSASSLHFFATTTEIPSDVPLDHFPSSLKSKSGSNRGETQLDLSASSQVTSMMVHQLRNTSETFWVRNSSSLQPLNFIIEPVAMYHPGLCLIKGGSASDACALIDYIQAVASPSSGTIPPGESMKISVQLEEASMMADGTRFHDNTDSPSAKTALLHKMRHHPSWRSNSWGADISDSPAETNAQNQMLLSIRDADMNVNTGVTSEVGVHLVLQQNPSAGTLTSDGTKQTDLPDFTLIKAAFAAREKRLTTSSKKVHVSRSLPTHIEDATRDHADSSTLDNFEEFDASSVRSGSFSRKSQLPVLTVRGCTPVANSSLENTRYVIDVGQHTVRNGGEVEWEITIESLYSTSGGIESGSLDPVDYRLIMVDKNANSWLQMSRDRGTLDRTRSYQSVVLYFLRDTVGVYSTFMVLQNSVNPSDLKVIHIRLEVIADLNSLRGMSTGLDPTTNLFRVLVSNRSNTRKRRSSIEVLPGNTHDSGLVIDYNEVYYHKLYHNHSIVLENSSSLTLDFMLSSNARPQEVSFSISSTSFNEISTVTLGAHARTQVFLHFRPQPQPVAGSSTDAVAREDTDHWLREIEVYVNCRLVKDFRETVILRAICNQPQLMVNVAASKPEGTISSEAMPTLFVSSPPSFLGAVFAMPEPILSNPGLAVAHAEEGEKYIVVRNTRSDVNGRLALRNDSMFFNVAIDNNLTQEGAVDVDYLENGVCAGRRSTVLVTIQPLCTAVFRVSPDVASLWKNHQLWDHSVKEHITLYNIKQFAEHYQVTLCFTCSNIASFYIPPNILESYPFSALEDIIAKFLQNYNYIWRRMITYHGKSGTTASPHAMKTSTALLSLSATALADILEEVENALDFASPLSPRNLQRAAAHDFDESVKRLEGLATSSTSQDRDGLRHLLQSYRALYFDFYYITDELVWYGVRGNAVRHSLMLADLVYGVVFNHEVFRTFLSPKNSDNMSTMLFPRLLQPWIRQLGHFLSFFPENQEATLPLRQVHDQLRRFEQVNS